eukprot:Gb_31627 [translate_table: standard]
MFLSAFDLKHLNAQYNQTLLMYKCGTEDAEYHSIVEQLKSSLSSVLVYFYPFAGRLVIGEDKRYAIECNDEGAEFIEARTNISFSHTQDRDFNPMTLYQRLVPTGKMSQCNACNGWPLLSVKVTRFVDGGLGVGIAVSHIVVDGRSLWHFIKSWAELSRGLPISLLPIHNRTLLKVNKSELMERAGNTDFTSKNQGNLEGVQSVIASSAKGKEQTGGIDDKLCYKTFYFSHDMVQNLKRLAMQDGKGPFSSFVAFSSHFWICMMKARGFADEEVVYFPLPVDCRRRINPPLPDAYFGNCVYATLVHTTAGKLFRGGISYGASLIAEAINSITDKSIRDYMGFAEKTGQYEKLMDENDVDNYIKGRFTAISQSAGTMSVYEELNFGWGKPVSVRSIRARFDSRGSVVVLPGPEGGSSIEATIVLPPDELQRLQSLLFSFDTWEK